MNDELYHYGVKGMKWGVRRYQNKDGSYTNKGRGRYNDSENKSVEKRKKTNTVVDSNGSSKNWKDKTDSELYSEFLNKEKYSTKDFKDSKEANKFDNRITGIMNEQIHLSDDRKNKLRKLENNYNKNHSKKTLTDMNNLRSEIDTIEGNYWKAYYKLESVQKIASKMHKNEMANKQKTSQKISQKENSFKLDKYSQDTIEKATGHGSAAYKKALDLYKKNNPEQVEYGEAEEGFDHYVWDRMQFDDFKIADPYNSIYKQAILDEAKKQGVKHSAIMDEELYHYGVKGMKWGVRRKLPHPIRNYRKRKKAIKRYNKKIEKNAKSLSDKELRDQINRRRLENEYLSTFTAKEKSMNRKKLDAALATTGNALAIGSAALSLGMAINDAKGRGSQNKQIKKRKEVVDKAFNLNQKIKNPIR